ncbi:MAG TPA: STAS domain-containing protein [Flavipsychrobacter sp.]
MEFKFDTKTTYTIVTPQSDVLNDKITGKLSDITKADYDNDGNNFIIDLQQCTSADNTSLGGLLALHDDCYAAQRSLVFTGVQPGVLRLLQNNDNAQRLNIAPTMQEAVDIISMEILERDLLSEE